MTIRQLSIPFNSHSENGYVNLPVLSSKQFLERTKQTEIVSASIFYKAKPIIRGSNGSSYLYLPNEVILSKFTPSCHEGLKIVCNEHAIWIGFIPFRDSSNQIKRLAIRKMHPFSHPLIKNLSIFPQRVNSKRNKSCLFTLPLTAQLHQKSSSQSCAILNVSLLLLFNRKKCALFCCEGSLPFGLPSQVFFCKEQSSSEEPLEKKSRKEEKGESSKKAVEESRSSKKEGKGTAEEARKRAEEARKRAEEARKRAEEARKRAKEARKKAEKAKKTAEKARKENEERKCTTSMMFLHQQVQ